MTRKQNIFFLCFTLFILAINISAADQSFEKDSFETSEGPLEITFIGHGTLMFSFAGKTIQVDPWSRLADYTKFPKADLILVTHEHGDHLDLKAIHFSLKPGTKVVYTELCSQKISSGILMHNGDSQTIEGIKVEAVPAYNIKHKRSNGTPFHPKGDGNGYVLTFGEKGLKVYVAGDTEYIPEMAELKDIDIAFLPMNLPYTMTPKMAAEAATVFRPKVLYPYHFGETETGKLKELLKEEENIEVRIRKLQ